MYTFEIDSTRFFIAIERYSMTSRTKISQTPALIRALTVYWARPCQQTEQLQWLAWYKDEYARDAQLDPISFPRTRAHAPGTG